LVDLDGAKDTKSMNLEVLYRITSKTNLKVDFGGGVKQKIDIVKVFDNGASQVTLGSMAVKNQALFMECLLEFGADRIILGADSRNGKIASNGWLQDSDINVLDFIESYVEAGIQYVVCTDIAKDGMLQGTSNDLYKEIVQKHNVKLVASGGVSCLNDLYELQVIGCEGAIIGKALYEGLISLKELSGLC
jgi:phosphoribosylformimino-5-aminoimidazole carboxamide ribotide isomerase